MADSVEDMEYIYLKTLLAPAVGSLEDLRRKNWINELGLLPDNKSSNTDLEYAFYHQEVPAAPTTWTIDDMAYEFYRTNSAVPNDRLALQDYRREYYAARV
jgi:hypothetical protein